MSAADRWPGTRVTSKRGAKAFIGDAVVLHCDGFSFALVCPNRDELKRAVDAVMYDADLQLGDVDIERSQRVGVLSEDDLHADPQPEAKP